jgi:Protein of unknown function (DUF2589)
MIRDIAAVELGDFIGSLLRSVIDAQQQSSRASVEFIEAIGWETVAEEDTAVTRLRTIKLRFRKKDENGNISEFEADVPLLTLINAPSLVVSEATLKFNYEVLATRQKPSEERSLGRKIAKAPLQLKGVVRSSPGSEGAAEARSRLGLDLQIVVKQQPAPVGIERLFDLAELGITQRPAP